MYSINLNLNNLPVVVIGGGVIAQRKVQALIAAQARIKVIAPKLTEELRDLHILGQFTWHKREYLPGDLRGAYLALVAINNKDILEDIAQEAKFEKVLINFANNTSLCDFTVPASLQQEDLTITVSTNGKSPALAKYLKNYLARKIPANYSSWLKIVENLRQEAIKTISTARGREEFWRLILDEDIMELVEQGEFQLAEERIKDAISSFRLKS